MTLGAVVAMMGLDGYLSGRPETVMGAALGLAAIGLLGLRFAPGLLAEIAVADTRAQAGVGRDTAEDVTAPVDAVRLTPIVGSVAGGSRESRVGGLPRLPDGVDWPERDGAPGRFLAQIACAELPAGLWDGSGPRQGALAVFRFAATSAGDWPVRVLHVDGALRERAAPKGVCPEPGWPLEVTPDDAACGTEPAPAPDWARLHAVDLSDPAFHPFDWTSASLLLTRIGTLLGDAAARLDSEAAQDDRARLAATARDLAELTAALWSERAESAFSDTHRARLVEGLSALSLEDPGKAPVPLIRHDGLRLSFFTPFERHCRQVHAAAPERLPQAQRALFEPLWAHNARHESGRMGSMEGIEPAESREEDAVLLLDLPSSELLGWCFGAGRSFRVFLDRDALARGDFSGAWARVVG